MKLQSHKVPIPVGLDLLRRWSHVNPLIVNYHMVSDEHLPYVSNLYRYRDIKTFTRDIEYYSTRYRIKDLQA